MSCTTICCNLILPEVAIKENIKNHGVQNESIFMPDRIGYPFFCFSLTYAMAAKTAPTLNNGEKWRIGYLEGGPWPDYQKTLIETVICLIDLGWIKKTELPELQNTDDTRMLWNWLSHNIKSDYLNFVEDAYWSSNWEGMCGKQTGVHAWIAFAGKR